MCVDERELAIIPWICAAYDEHIKIGLWLNERKLKVETNERGRTMSKVECDRISESRSKTDGKVVPDIKHPHTLRRVLVSSPVLVLFSTWLALEKTSTSQESYSTKLAMTLLEYQTFLFLFVKIPKSGHGHISNFNLNSIRFYCDLMILSMCVFVVMCLTSRERIQFIINSEQYTVKQST